MPERDHEFAAPSDPPPPAATAVEPPSQRMTNEDFRKLMMTPRSSSGSTASSSTASKDAAAAGGATPSGALGAAAMTPRLGGSTRGTAASSERAERRKKKKSYYAKLKKQEDDKMAELAAKYRDRARERRDGLVGGVERQGEDPNDASTTSGYRAVAPDVKSTFDAKERRRQMIQESKFLGGDMEHTHLVKGLDFALLQKVRSEIAHREAEGGEGDSGGEGTENVGEATAVSESAASGEAVKAAKKATDKEVSVASISDPVDELQKGCRTNMTKTLIRTVFKPDVPKVNELFFPGRMAYVIDLEEDESDIPTTTIRSKADVDSATPGGQHQAATLSTNDIVINKLTQILSYLRAGSRNKKKKKEKLLHAMDKEEQQRLMDLQGGKRDKPQQPSLSIYDDVGEYKPNAASRRDDRERNKDSRHSRDDYKSSRDRDRDYGSGRRRDYFNKRDEGDEDRGDKEHAGGLTSQDKDYIRKLSEREKEKEKRVNAAAKGGIGLATSKPEGYAECYPGLEEMNDAIDDSDDEADYTKMDLGNKKGPMGRWDFDTPEEYADYMSRKEALPKAAFQYGVKMAEGRKTRGKVGVKSEKAKLDREWNKISALIDKRKGGGGGGEAKKARME